MATTEELEKKIATLEAKVAGLERMIEPDKGFIRARRIVVWDWTVSSILPRVVLSADEKDAPNAVIQVRDSDGNRTWGTPADFPPEGNHPPIDFGWPEMAQRRRDGALP